MGDCRSDNSKQIPKALKVLIGGINESGGEPPGKLSEKAKT
jgi:hypothetical protein